MPPPMEMNIPSAAICAASKSQMTRPVYEMYIRERGEQ